MSERTDEIRAFLARAQAARRGGAPRGVSGTSGAALAIAAESPDGAAAPGWDSAQLAGRLIELSGVGAVASLTAAIGLVLDAQRRGDPAAWIALAESTFYPPDVADSGVDLQALIVVRVARAAGRALACEAAARAADRLVRSGGFGLVVLDLGKDAEISVGLQGRLAGLAQRHDVAIVCLTEKATAAASLGSMVSLRAEAVRSLAPPSAVAGGDGSARFACQVHVLKDKRRGSRWSHAEVVRAPPGLR